MYRSIIFSIFFICFQVTHAQEPAYIQYGVEDGLPSSLVYCMLQDQRGFLWFGTDKGLARFDGFRFKVFSIKDGLPDSEVLNMFEDSKGRIWLSCFQKKPCYFHEGEFRTAENDSVLAQADTKSGTYTFFEDEEGVIWVAGNDRNICRYNDIAFICEKPLDQNGFNYMPLHIFSINNSIYAVTATSIYDYSPKVNSKLVYHPISYNEFSLNHVPSVSHQSENIFFLHENDLIQVKLNGKNYSEKTYNLDIPIGEKTICHIEENNIWLCYIRSPKGAYKIDLHSKDPSYLKTSPFANGYQILSTFKRGEGPLWFSSMNKGALALTSQPAITYNKKNNPILKSENISAIKAHKNNIFIGDDIGNLYKLVSSELNLLKLKEKIPIDRIRQIQTSIDLSFLFITDRHLYLENKGELKVKYLSSLFEGLKKERKVGAYKATYIEGNKIWIGTNKVLLTLENNGNTINVKLEETRITAIGADSEQNVWAATVDGFLSEKDSFQTNWGAKFKPLAGRILDIKATSDGKLWVATSENGLLRVEVNNGEVFGFEIINKKIPSPIENIKSLFAALDGKIWVATSNGVYSLDEELNVKHFNTSDGLPSNDVNAVAVQQDTLWAATVAGLSKIQLNQPLESNDFRTFISGISYYVDNKNINNDLIYRKENSITLPSGTSLVELQFSGLHFGSQGNITYEVIETKTQPPSQWLTWDNFKYLVSSKFGNFIDTTYLKSHSKNYGINVPSGCSEIVVTAITKNGVKSIHSDKLILTVLPAWHETLWLNILLIGTAMLIGWIYYRQTTAVKRLKQETNDLQLQAIKAQINPHFIGNSINAIQQFFYPPNPSKASQYISNFSNMLRRTMHLSDASFIPLHEEIQFISDYLEMVKLRFEDRFHYTVLTDNAIDPETPFPAMILQPIVENATIHGLAENGETIIDINFEKNKYYISCIISDNGIGISRSIETKKGEQNKRISKGIDLLKKKISIINKMHKIDLKIDFIDITNTAPGGSGTMVTISYKTK